jgi:membrane protease YdiL (CAAX protease family)
MLGNRQFSARWDPILAPAIVLSYLIVLAILPKGPGTQYTIKSVLMSPQIFFLAVLIIVMLILRIRPTDIGLSAKGFWKNFRSGILASLIPAALVVGLLLIPVSIYQVVSSGRMEFLENFAGGQFLFRNMAIIQLLILAPVCEELFFRGFMIPPLTKRMPVWLVILLSSVVFMLAHGYFKPGAFLLGIFTSVIFLKTGSVIPGMIFHFTCNLWGPTLTYFLPNLYKVLSPLFR